MRLNIQNLPYEDRLELSAHTLHVDRFDAVHREDASQLLRGPLIFNELF